jgi:hypothetical protein
MTMKTNTKPILALLLTSIIFFQSCMTIIHGTFKELPVTSHPVGAKIIADGEEVGFTPLILELKRKKSHSIRIEKEGYAPFAIIIKRKNRWLESILLNWLSGGAWIGYMLALAIGEVLFPEWNLDDAQTSMAMLWSGAAGAVIVDSFSGANYFFSPKELEVTLSKIEDKSEANFILIDEEQLQNIKWIRIRSAS